MRKAVIFILAMALLIGSGMAVAQEKGGAQAPEKPMMGPGMMGPGMMCPCMMMMGHQMSQMSPEDQKKMQEEMRQWMQACPMMKMMGPKQQPQQPPAKK
ncbi:MAG: hypothetical protein Q8M54_06190 [Desulfobaccales bacterium]|nr:hypothetical protein [Desulfobaccales bacterium]